MILRLKLYALNNTAYAGKKSMQKSKYLGLQPITFVSNAIKIVSIFNCSLLYEVSGR